MASKHLKIVESVYEDLTKFRDENNLASYTEAIKELLKFYRSTTTKWFEISRSENIPTFPELPTHYQTDEEKI